MNRILVALLIIMTLLFGCDGKRESCDALGCIVDVTSQHFTDYIKDAKAIFKEWGENETKLYYCVLLISHRDNHMLINIEYPTGRVLWAKNVDYIFDYILFGRYVITIHISHIDYISLKTGNITSLGGYLNCKTHVREDLSVMYYWDGISLYKAWLFNACKPKRIIGYPEKHVPGIVERIFYEDGYIYLCSTKYEHNKEGRICNWVKYLTIVNVENPDDYKQMVAGFSHPAFLYIENEKVVAANSYEISTHDISSDSYDKKRIFNVENYRQPVYDKYYAKCYYPLVDGVYELDLRTTNVSRSQLDCIPEYVLSKDVYLAFIQNRIRIYNRNEAHTFRIFKRDYYVRRYWNVHEKNILLIQIMSANRYSINLLETDFLCSLLNVKEEVKE